MFTGFFVFWKTLKYLFFWIKLEIWGIEFPLYLRVVFSVYISIS